MVKGQYTSDLETYADRPLEEIGVELDARGSLPEIRRPPGSSTNPNQTGLREIECRRHR